MPTDPTLAQQTDIAEQVRATVTALNAACAHAAPAGLTVALTAPTAEYDEDCTGFEAVTVRITREV